MTVLLCTDECSLDYFFLFVTVEYTPIHIVVLTSSCHSTHKTLLTSNIKVRAQAHLHTSQNTLPQITVYKYTKCNAPHISAHIQTQIQINTHSPQISLENTFCMVKFSISSLAASLVLIIRALNNIIMKIRNELK